VKPAWFAAALGVVLARLATAQVAILQIQVLEGEGYIHAPGSRSPRPVVVEVTDEIGNPIAGAAVSFHLPEQGPSGTFANGLRTDVGVTDERGHAAPRALLLNRVPGQFQIRIIATKEQATAGIISLQLIADAASAKEAHNAAPSTSAKAAAAHERALVGPPPGHGHKKVAAIILGTVGAGAAAGVLATRSSKSGGNSSAAATPAGVASPPSIGAPSITVGKP
jgi:hypothetical protein